MSHATADFDVAASLYRDAREAGMTVRNAMDCLIARELKILDATNPTP